MAFRTTFILLIACAVSFARTLCPCPPERAPAVQAMESHSCCDKTPGSEIPPVCPKHGPDCSHCHAGVQLAPTDKATESPAPVPTPIIPLEAFRVIQTPTPIVAPLAEVLPTKSPPDRCALHCVYVI